MKLTQILDALAQRDAFHLLDCGRRGIEKEGLRYTYTDRLSEKSHPKTLGSPLTHQEVTTDYAESLLEIVTPAFRNSRDTQAHLCYLHRVLAQDSYEYMLNGSMPAYIADTEAVQIGWYGRSHAGQMRRLYRKGLALRYGKAMQLIAGMHFNYSICNRLFNHYAEILGCHFNRQFVDQCYMNLVRNLRRYAWLTAYLFGHSPAVDKSFLHGKSHTLDTFDDETLYLPHATSLRMSDIGYQNKTGHLVSANSLAQYIHDLAAAVKTPCKAFEQMGLYDVNGDYQQINTNLLQIENEYYTAARPKQLMISGEPPLRALADRGVAYVELRTLDINCFERTGISQNQLDFLEVFMLFCLFDEAPIFDKTDEKEAKTNMANISRYGRDPEVLINNRGQPTGVSRWGSEILEAMRPIAEAMDSEKHRPHYVSLIERELEVVANPELTPSARIMRHLSGEITGTPMSYHQFITNLSRKHMQVSREMGLTPAEKAKVDKDAEISLKKEKKLAKKSKKTTFDTYLNDYFEQIEDL
ncbi:MAG: glutamate--cysteine ligase [Gammaproteobacteria bacterium]|nr:MAG: glutamate--cysteine ligase [Gammaproteobacteria bacterium]